MKMLITLLVAVALLVLVDKAHRYWVMYGPQHKKKD